MNTQQKSAKPAMTTAPGMAVRTDVKCGQVPQEMKEILENAFLFSVWGGYPDSFDDVSAEYVFEHPDEIQDLAKWLHENCEWEWGMGSCPYS